mgnify:CR=1 FL=1
MRHGEQLSLGGGDVEGGFGHRGRDFGFEDADVPFRDDGVFHLFGGVEQRGAENVVAARFGHFNPAFGDPFVIGLDSAFDGLGEASPRKGVGDLHAGREG